MPQVNLHGATSQCYAARLRSGLISVKNDSPQVIGLIKNVSKTNLYLKCQTAVILSGRIVDSCPCLNVCGDETCKHGRKSKTCYGVCVVFFEGI